MYVKLYPEVLSRSASVEAFVRSVWQLVGGGTQLPLAYDPVSAPSAKLALPLLTRFLQACHSSAQIHLDRDPCRSL